MDGMPYLTSWRAVVGTCSTLTSKDFCLSRPTTRVHAAPGGNSSISFGSYEEPKVNKENIVAAPAVVEKKVESVVAPAPVVQETVAVQRRRQPPGGASSFSLGW